MIKLRQPSLVLHSCDVPGYKYIMSTSWVMSRGATAGNVVSWINMAIQSSPELYLNNVVINCHGSPGAIHVGGCGDGGRAIYAGHTGVFKGVKRGSLGTIYIVACEVSQDPDGNDWGTEFCRQLAINAGCFVVAANKIQSVDWWFDNINHPYGCIDDYEGVVSEFSPSGSHKPWNPGDATGTSG